MKYYKYRSIIISHNKPNLHRLETHSQHKKMIAEFKSAKHNQITTDRTWLESNEGSSCFFICKKMNTV